MNNKLCFISASLACIANGAVSNIANAKAITFDNNSSNDSSDLTKLSLDGIKIARNYPVMQHAVVGSSVSSSGAASINDDCYSNCYAEPSDICHSESVQDQCAELSPGYTLTSCASGSTLTGQCPISGGGAYYQSCVTIASQCAALSPGYTKTSCTTGYTLTNQCPISGGSAYYQSCVASCHTESVADQCAESSPSYTLTSCDTGYTLTNQCTVSGGEAYYESCTCHTDTTDCDYYSSVITSAQTAFKNVLDASLSADYTHTGCTTVHASIYSVFEQTTEICTIESSGWDTALSTTYNNMQSAYTTYVLRGCGIHPNPAHQTYSCYSNAAICHTDCHTDSAEEACNTLITQMQSNFSSLLTAAVAIKNANSFSTCSAQYPALSGIYSTTTNICLSSTNTTLNSNIGSAYSSLNANASTYNNNGCAAATLNYECYANGTACHSDTTVCSTWKSTITSRYAEKTSYPYACRRVYYYTDTTGTSALPYCSGLGGYTTGSTSSSMTMTEYNSLLTKYNSLCTSTTGTLSTSTYTLKVYGTSGTGVETCFPQTYTTGSIVCANAY